MDPRAVPERVTGGRPTAPGSPLEPWPRSEELPPRERLEGVDRERTTRRDASDPSVWIDPLARSLAVVRCGSESRELAAPVVIAPETLRMLRRIAWGSDASRAVAYLELGAGVLAGAALTLELRGGRLSVLLELPAGCSGADWEQRLLERLERRGLSVASIRVR